MKKIEELRWRTSRMNSMKFGSEEGDQMNHGKYWATSMKSI